MAAEPPEIRDDPVGTVEALGDEYSVRILGLTSRRESSAKQISESLDIPIATVYRRLEDLQGAGLLDEAGTELNDEGKRVTLYESLISSVTVSFESGEPVVDFERQSEAARTIDDEWRDIKEDDRT